MPATSTVAGDRLPDRVACAERLDVGGAQRVAADPPVTAVYVDVVIVPGLAHPRGVASLHGLCDAYVSLMERRVFPGGCFFAAAMAEFDARPGVVRDAVAAAQRQWLDLLERTGKDAIAGGELERRVDPAQLSFELEAAMLSANWYFHLYDDTGFFGRARRAVESTIHAAATAKGRAVLDRLAGPRG